MIARIQLIAAAAVAAFLCPSPALAWGKTGHRVTAAVADTHLSGLARAHVREIIGVESLAEASNWPDEMRSNPDPFWQKTSSPWHYVTVGGVTYDHAPPEGDALGALNFFRGLVLDPKTSPDQRQLALRFIVHIVGDLHQHLHAIWDSALVDETGYSFSEYSERLTRHTSSGDVIAWWNPRPTDWIAESVRLREGIYPAEGTTELGYDYIYQHTPTMELRLKQAGVRLAAYLNQMFSEPTATKRK